MKIKIPKCKFRLFLFCLYNLFFVLYMLGYMSNIYYLIFISLFCFSNLVVLLYNKKFSLKKGFRELKLGLSYVIVFLIVSLVIQIFNNDINFSLFIGDIIRFIIPVINAFLFINSVDKAEQKVFFDIFLIRFVLQFIFSNLNNLSLSNILSISWGESSSAMESSLAHDFFIMELFYLMSNNKKYAFICMLFCMLSMKRLSFILAPIIFIFAYKIPKDKPVKTNFLNALKTFAIISPFIIMLFYSKNSIDFFRNNFNFDLNQFMSGRIDIYHLLINNIPYYNGLGSINNFLSVFTQKYFGTVWNGVLHNDFLRLYLETTILGVCVFANNIIEICKKNYWHFLMITYLIIISITSHILNYFSVWVTMYMAVMYYNYNKTE